MSFKKTLIMALVLLLVGAFIYLVEMPHTEKKSKAESMDSKILDLDWDALDRVEIVAPNRKIVAVKKGEDWMLEAPVKDQADPYQVRAVANAIRFTGVTRRIDKLEKPLSVYGLDSPRLQVTLRAGTVSKTVLVGNHYKIGGSLFIKQASGSDVMIVPNSLFASLDKSVEAIRESQVFREDFGPIVGIKVRQKGETVELKKVLSDLKEGEFQWKFVSPFTAWADSELVDEIISKMPDMVARDFIQDGGIAGSLYGLTPPEAEITFAFEKEIKPEGEDSEEQPAEIKKEIIEKTLLVGHPSQGGIKRFAAVDGRLSVINIDASEVEPFLKELKTYIDRHLLRFNGDQISKIGLQISGSLAKLSDSDSGWVFEDGRNADKEKINALFEGLMALAGEKLDAPKWAVPRYYGIGKTTDKITVEFNDGRPALTLAVGKKNAKLDSVTLARVESKKYDYYNVAEEQLSFWPKSTEEFIAAVPDKPEEEKATVPE